MVRATKDIEIDQLVTKVVERVQENPIPGMSDLTRAMHCVPHDISKEERDAIYESALEKLLQAVTARLAEKSDKQYAFRFPHRSSQRTIMAHTPRGQSMLVGTRHAVNHREFVSTKDRQLPRGDL